MTREESPLRAENHAFVTIGWKAREGSIGLMICGKMSMDIEAVGWLETMEFVDISGAVVREARFFAYPKKAPSAFPLNIHSQCFDFVGYSIRMNGELPEGIFVREKFSELSRITKPEQLAELKTYYETDEWRCLRA